LVFSEIDAEMSKTYFQVGINNTMPIELSEMNVKNLNNLIHILSLKRNIPMDSPQEEEEEHEKVVSTEFKLPIWKRLFDIVFSLAALIALSPLLLATAIAIRLESKGSVIYKSKRVGSNYHIFNFLKFRSMYVDADKHLKDFNNLNQYQGEEEAQEDDMSDIILPDGMTMDDLMVSDDIMISDDINPDEVILVSDDSVVSEQSFLKQRNNEQKNSFVKLENDPRITRVGRIIRKYSIDELPQLINILKGDMSVVGNRPLPLYEAELLTSDEYIDRFLAPAGLTGLWQVEKRGDSGKMSAEERKMLDIKYAKTFSFWLDIKIILKTVTAFVQKENV
jgi:lipopolysaccharide/colanic/teichoic acid biosynthesis glycosyltransferase